MRYLLLTLFAFVFLTGSHAVGEEPRYSANMVWLRDSQPVMKFFIDFLEPLERANLAATRYLTGELNRENALYELDQARSAMSMISDNLDWSIGMMQPAPEGGSAATRALIAQMSDLTPRLHDINTSVDQAISLLETFVKDDSYRAYKGGVQQSVASIDMIGRFVDPFSEINRLSIADWDDLSLNMAAASKLDDILSFEMIGIFYASVILFDEPLPERRISQFVVDLDRYGATIDKLEKSLVRTRREAAADSYGSSEYYQDSLKKIEVGIETKRKRKTAFHKLLASLSTPAPSPDLIDAAYSELMETYEIELPPYKRAFANAERLSENNNRVEPADEQTDAGVDTPL